MTWFKWVEKAILVPVGAARVDLDLGGGGARATHSDRELV
jgi:hypothetical protein